MLTTSYTKKPSSAFLTSKHYSHPTPTPEIPDLMLVDPESVLEESIKGINFLRFIKETKNKPMQEIFDLKSEVEFIKVFNPKSIDLLEEAGNETGKVATPENLVNLEFLKRVLIKELGVDIDDEHLETMLRIFTVEFKGETTEIDFVTFCRIFYLVANKKKGEEGGKEHMFSSPEEIGVEEEEEDEDLEGELNFD